MDFKDVKNRDRVAHELAEGRELANQLFQKLLEPSIQLYEVGLLMDRILAAYEKALNMVTFITRFERSYDHVGDCLRPSKKRRNRLARRVEKVKLSEGEELPSDGYSWRKYGQKIILGAKFRRGYFRCSHRHSQGCPALKQVQKSDDDPTIFHVAYVDNHTCTPPSTNKNLPRVHLDPTQQSQEADQQTRTQPGSLAHPAVFTPMPCSLGSESVPSLEPNINYALSLESWFPAGFFAPNSSINELEFTLEDLDIGPNFPFDNAEMFA